MRLEPGALRIGRRNRPGAGAGLVALALLLWTVSAEAQVPVGSIVIEKSTSPQGGTGFAFTETIDGQGFRLDDGQSRTFSSIAPGEYQVTENVPAGWHLGDISCVGSSGGVNIDVANATVSISLNAEETITCTFTNVELGSITIIKDAVPDAAQDFVFTGDIPGGGEGFTLDDDADPVLPNSRTFTDILPGFYQVGEAVPAGWLFDDASVCTDDDSSFDGPTAFINLDPGEDVTCTFVNFKLSDIGFSKAFIPATIGRNSTTRLEFTIDNPEGAIPATDVSFTDLLPFGTEIATPPSATTTCTDGLVSAPAGGTTVGLTGARLPADASCRVAVNVTGTRLGDHLNVSGSLTSSTGSSGAASATLTVDGRRPEFVKSFAPSTISLGGTSTLELAITDGAGVGQLEFTDVLPTGMVIATPPNVLNTCAGTLSFGETGNTIILTGGSVAPRESCAVSVDVTTTRTGTFVNTTSELLSGSPAISSGFATAALEVPAEFLVKSFIDDPVPPGGTVALRFVVTNLDRDGVATAISFTDTVDPLGTLGGLGPAETLPKAACGGTLGFAAGVLTFSGGSLPAGGSCSFSVALAVPLSAAAGSFTNTTSAITAEIGGESVTGNAATDVLAVSTDPILTKEFVDDPVGAGGSATLRFTISNGNPDTALTGIEFTDNLETAIPGLAANGLVNGNTTNPLLDPCGTGSVLTVFDPPDTPPFVFPPDPTQLVFSGGSLAPAGSPGDTCSFDVEVDLPAGVPAGIYLNTTSEITGNLFTEVPVTGRPASGELLVVAAPRLTKEFIDDPALPGDTVTLLFELMHPEEAPGDASAIGFTDDLAATISGLTARGLPLNDLCGPGNGTLSGSAMDTRVSVSGVTLRPGEACSFSVTLDIPATAPAGRHTNTTSSVIATVAGVATTGRAAADDLRIGGMTLTKEFLDDPVLPGETVTLRFTIENSHPTENASDISFQDDLDAVVENMAALGLPLNDLCGPGNGSLSGTAGNTLLSFSSGSLDAGGSSCSFDVVLEIPASASSDSYVNSTCCFDGSPSGFRATVGGSSVFFEDAVDDLTISNELLFLSKEFLDDPVAPGGTVTLEFTLANLDDSETITGIGFTDDLNATLPGLAAVGPLSTGTCTGSLSGTSLLSYSGGSLAPGSSCTFAVTLAVPAAARLGSTVVNTTSQVTGTIGVEGPTVVGDPAIDELMITLGFAKAFDLPAVPGDSATLTFTLRNPDATASVEGLSFSDNLAAVVPGLMATGLPASDVCGPGSQLSGTSFILMTGGSLPPGGSCTIPVTLQVPSPVASGSYPNTTSELLLADGVVVAGPATDDLTVINPGIEIQKTPDLQTILIGGSAAFTITVNNTGDVGLTDVVVADARVASCARVIPTLAAGAGVAYGCTTDGVIADFTNIANVTAQTPAGTSVADSDTAVVDVLNPAIDIDKGPDLQTILPGGTATFSITVTNTGDARLDNVSVSDPAVSDCSRASLGSLAAGETISYSCTLGSVSASFTNTAATGADTQFETRVSDSDNAQVVVIDAAIEITKTPVSPEVYAGQSATFTIGLRNTGEGLLTDLSVSDPLSPTCSRASGSLPDLPVGGHTSYTCDTAPLAVSLLNQATVTAESAAGSISASASALVEVLDPIIDITKTPESQQILAGQTASFTITIRNVGTVDLIGLDVSDLQTPSCESPGGIEDPEPLPNLGPGQSIFWDCESEPLVFDLTNVVTVSAVTREGLPLSASASAFVDVISPIEISKSPAEQEIPQGQAATFGITVSNPGRVSKTNVIVSDPLTPDCDADLANLAPGATVSYTCSTDPLFADLTNVATVTAQTPAGPVEANATALVRVLEPSIAVSKEPAAQVVSRGSSASFTITVSNPGTTRLTGVRVADPLTPGCARFLSDLPPGGSESYACSSGPVAVDFTNVATATANAGGLPVSASASAEVNVRQPIVIVKAPAEQTVAFGTAATFTITITNEEADVKTAVAVADPLSPDCERAVGELGDLAPDGGSVTYTCTSEPLTADLVNVATVTAAGDDGPVIDSDSAVVTVATEIVLTKTPVAQEIEAGLPVTFTIEVTNGGDEVLTEVAVSDPETPACDRTLGEIQVGASVSYDCTTEPLFADLINVATATGRLTEGAVTAIAVATVDVIEPLTILKQPDEQEIQAGEAASFTITVSNPSGVTRTNVRVSDPLTPDCDRPAGVLGNLRPGRSISYSCNTTPLFGDLTNVATASAESPAGTVTATANAVVRVLQPVIEIVKAPIAQVLNAGDRASFTITLSNPGSGSLTDLAVVDPLTRNCDRAVGSLPTLPAGVSTSYTCRTGPLTADLTNVATVTAMSATGVVATASASAAVNIRQPIVITKAPLEQTVFSGESATFTITVVNEQEDTKTNVRVVDPRTPDCSRSAAQLGELQPNGGSVSYTCSTGPLTARLLNVATVTAVGGEGPVSDRASALVKVIEREADLSLSLRAIHDPAVGGKLQLFEATISNLGPQDASGIIFEQELPTGTYYFGMAPSRFSCTLSSGMALACDLERLAAGDTRRLTVGVLIDHRFDGSHATEAMVSSDEVDPNLSDNEAEITTPVAPARAILATRRADGTAISAMVAKEAEQSLGLVVTQAAGGGDRRYSLTSLGYRTVAMTEVVDFAGTAAPEMGLLGFSFDGSLVVNVLDADSLELIGSHPIAGTWLPRDLEPLPHFAGSAAPELALLVQSPSDSSTHVVVIDGSTGAVLADHLVAAGGPDVQFPIDMSVMADFDGTPSPELAVVSRDQGSGASVVTVIDGGSGAQLATKAVAVNGYPIAIESVGNLSGSSVEELAVGLRRGVGVPAPTVEIVDAVSSSSPPSVGFAIGIEPEALIRVPDFGATAAQELAVAGRDGDQIKIEVRDALDASLVGSTSVGGPVLPLALAAHPSFAGGPDPELSLLFELLGLPTEINVYEASGGLPLFNFVLP